MIGGFGPEEWSQGGRGQVLAPWPNRLGDGRYNFEGRPPRHPWTSRRGNAIHGLVRWLPWRMAGRAQNRVTMGCVLHPSPAYPFTLGLTWSTGSGVRGSPWSPTPRTSGAGPSRSGSGFHPYLTVGTPLGGPDRLTVPAGPPPGHRRAGPAHRRGAGGGHRVRLHRRAGCSVPPVSTRPSPGLRRDTGGRVRVTLEAGAGAGDDAASAGTRSVTLWADERFDHLMVYTGDTLAAGGGAEGGGRRADDLPAGRLPVRDVGSACSGPVAGGRARRGSQSHVERPAASRLDRG